VLPIKPYQNITPTVGPTPHENLETQNSRFEILEWCMLMQYCDAVQWGALELQLRGNIVGAVHWGAVVQFNIVLIPTQLDWNPLSQFLMMVMSNTKSYKVYSIINIELEITIIIFMMVVTT